MERKMIGFVGEVVVERVADVITSYSRLPLGANLKIMRDDVKKLS